MTEGKLLFSIFAARTNDQEDQGFHYGGDITLLMWPTLDPSDGKMCVREVFEGALDNYNRNLNLFSDTCK